MNLTALSNIITNPRKIMSCAARDRSRGVKTFSSVEMLTPIVMWHSRENHHPLEINSSEINSASQQRCQLWRWMCGSSVKGYFNRPLVEQEGKADPPLPRVRNPFPT